jgi:hypothetical protein
MGQNSVPLADLVPYFETPEQKHGEVCKKEITLLSRPGKKDEVSGTITVLITYYNVGYTLERENFEAGERAKLEASVQAPS